MGFAFLRLAWRNLGRNRRRTAITCLALALGTALCVGTYGLVDGYNANLLTSLTRFDLGHIQVHHPEFPKKRALKYAFDKADEIVALARKLKGVNGASTRIYGAALISRGDKSAGVMLVGVDPRREPSVTVLDKTITSGAYLDAQPTPWPRGRQLTKAELDADKKLTKQAEKDATDELDALDSLDSPKKKDAKRPTSAPSSKSPGQRETRQSLSRRLAQVQSPPPGRAPNVIIGVSLAKLLRASVGDTLFVMSFSVDGYMEEVYVRVAGIYKTGATLHDRARLYMHLADLQRMSHLYGKVHEVAVTIDRVYGAQETVAQLKRVLNRPALLVRSWDEIRPDIKHLLSLSRTQMVIVVFIVFLIATLGVVNTMLMAVFERTREFGVLKAIGMSGGRIFRLIVLETLALVLIGAVIGTLLGLGIDLYLVFVGIDLSSITEGVSIGGVGMRPQITGQITTAGVLTPLVVLGFSSLLASFWPAARAARMQPAAGMREL